MSLQVYVLGIYRTPDIAKLSEFDVILCDVFSRFDANDFGFIFEEFNLDTISVFTPYIWSNKMLSMTSGIVPIDVTGHMPVFIAFPVVSTNKGEYFIKYFRDHSKECLYLFEISLINFSDNN